MGGPRPRAAYAHSSLSGMGAPLLLLRLLSPGSPGVEAICRRLTLMHVSRGPLSSQPRKGGRGGKKDALLHGNIRAHWGGGEISFPRGWSRFRGGPQLPAFLHPKSSCDGTRGHPPLPRRVIGGSVSRAPPPTCGPGKWGSPLPGGGGGPGPSRA